MVSVCLSLVNQSVTTVKSISTLYLLIMKLLVLAVLVGVATAASFKNPREEAAELLYETAQLDEALKEKRELTAEKRSFASSSYGYPKSRSYEGGNFEYHEPHVPSYPEKAPGFDLWGFKRAILGALYQAVRAVAGGSISVKGQIIKGGGNLLATQGKLIASGGQAVTDLGRNIAHSALHAAPVVPATPVYHQHHTISAPSAGYGYGGYSSSSYGHHEPGVLDTIVKAKVAVGSAVGNAVGNVVSGAAGAVGSAVAGAAGAVAGVVSGAADAVTHHVNSKLVPSNAHAHAPTPTYHHQNYVPAAPVNYKPSASKAELAKPIRVVDSPAPAVDAAVTYGGSLEESFGAPAAAAVGYDHYSAPNPEYSIQPSISYDLQ